MADILAGANITLSLLLKLAFFAFVGRCMRLPPVNFLTASVLIWLPIDLLRLIAGPAIRLDGGILNRAYQEWLAVENVYSVVQLALAALTFRLAFLRPVAPPELILSHNPAYARLASGMFIFIFGLSFIATASLGFGVLNWLADPRAGYQFHREGIGPFYALMSSAASVAMFFALCGAKHRAGLLITFLAFLPALYLIGSKGIILRMLVLTVVIYLFRFRTIPISVLLVGSVAGVSLVIANFGSIDVIEIFRYFDFYPNSALIYEAVSNNRLSLFGGKVTLTEYWAMVPRGLFPDKPYVFGQVILSDLLYPGIAAKGHTVGFAGPIVAYADFGGLGVLLAAVMDPVLYVDAALLGLVAQHYIRGGPDTVLRNPVLTLVVLYLLVPDALIYFGFPLNVLFLTAIAGLIAVAGRINVTFGLPSRQRRRPAL